ncbi:sulfotransferase family 2 domain-containing protein [Oceanicella sp. SM1341]|uniref:sulfotransferase family 2 domain-containing protein n=1 Tax=Oceanicella sp. SM1341 TaxID=1548889 RepID=UPI000E4A48F1|nr:sulfotransferase family 2 domain-containing protein [Oceanicella sp. SM1341]
MASRRYSAEEIRARLDEVTALLGRGVPLAEAVRSIGVTQPTYTRWRKRAEAAAAAPPRPAPASGAPARAPHRLFYASAAPEAQDRAVNATFEAFPEQFPDRAAAWGFLFQVILPPSLRWGFISVGKNASSSTLRLLFRAEFGCDMSVRATPEHDINPSAALHMLVDHGVFSRAVWQGHSAQRLIGSNGPKERICVVREPFGRAVSGFRYLCKSHRAKSLWFARDRFRINAALGFDWDRHPDTAEGFRLFLRYVQWQAKTEGLDAIDAHWRPQVTFIKPEVFRPSITGRMEDMESYYRTLSERLDIALPDEGIWENRQSAAADELLQDREAHKLCQSIYAIDYEAFSY